MLWIAFAVLALLSVLLLTGHGAWLIAGYNTAAREEKNKYDQKKLCRTAGAGMAVIAVLILLKALCGENFPTLIMQIIALIDCIVMVVLMNTICKRR